MSPIRASLMLCIVAALTACATTPEQKAAREQAQRRYEQDLQVSLAAECDPETAKLMRKQFEQAEQVGTPSAEQKAFRLKYIDKVSDPMFQACYKMAWQNYISQQQLREARYYRYYDEWGFPFYRPYYWW